MGSNFFNKDLKGSCTFSHFFFVQNMKCFHVGLPGRVVVETTESFPDGLFLGRRGMSVEGGQGMEINT